MDKHAAGRAILSHALPHVPFDGWTKAVLENAAAEAGFTPQDLVRVFPGGPIDALNLFARQADAEMLAAYAALSPAPAKIRERIAALVRLRLETLAQHKEAMRRARAAYAMPAYAPHGMAALCRTVDAMWQAAGDTATDFNWYTKRFLLSGVYSSTQVVWLNDTTDGHAATWEFLSRRIEDVMKIQGLKKQLLSFVIARSA